jgi:hypothetical protein
VAPFEKEKKNTLLSITLGHFAQGKKRIVTFKTMTMGWMLA